MQIIYPISLMFTLSNLQQYEYFITNGKTNGNVKDGDEQRLLLFRPTSGDMCPNREFLTLFVLVVIFVSGVVTFSIISC
ncbi:hypothetical protein X798_08020 [Onchocerca flexuosa]|uniref:Uncharacterized protein n=1 Tax=Onchocerca flexuosa TaxID=387005 RepID=A0A238BHR3_9BILA|nr:hypothetical protein X798_08020 [Onchocerca flexuosa]